MPRQLVLTMLFIYLGVSGCSWWQPASHLAQTVSIPLLKPIGPARRIVQAINAQWQGRQHSFLCVLELDQHHLAIAGLSPQGMGLFNLSYDGKQVSMTHSPLMPKQLPPDMIVKDVQLAYWPLPILQQRLPKPWKIAMPKGNPKQRQLYFNDELVAEVSYLQSESTSPKTVELINHRFHYKLFIHTISYEIIPK